MSGVAANSAYLEEDAEHGETVGWLGGFRDTRTEVGVPMNDMQLKSTQWTFCLTKVQVVDTKINLRTMSLLLSAAPISTV